MVPLAALDEVADVEDEDDYQSNARVKRQNVASRLRFIVLDTKRARYTGIVAVAANPFGYGCTDYAAIRKIPRVVSYVVLCRTATSEKIVLQRRL